MATYLTLKTKRKDLEDDFSEFSLSSPARKMRRLDVELPPIMEEEELGIHQPNQTLDYAMENENENENERVFVNEERALVLYKPVDTPLLQFKLNRDLIPSFNHQLLRSTNFNLPVAADTERRYTGEVSGTDNCMAVVPYQPSLIYDPAAQMVEPMEAEESEEMEIEDSPMQQQQQHILSDGVHQQWTQHCMTPQIPQNTSTPIMWSWG
ncbi:hypothetical protein GIB67_043169 [Kingdonia uniflora]|uniref:Uncharacterized protein n=1 Tax=Kingdonia uniflora TaxID=39325 RepID=A0A7J7NK83_9MAGN|nr:hypothetical protein GIB67_043169 [Kingdonia uniflora]